MAHAHVLKLDAPYMEYQVNCGGQCYESMCHSQKAAVAHARELKRKFPQRHVEVFRYDRHQRSDYFERVLSL